MSDEIVKRPPPGRKSRAGLLKEIERLTEELSMEEECFENLANDFKRVEAENRKLRYVMETAQTMREDYECYSLSEDGTYGTELHDPEIMKDFDNAIEAIT